MMSSSTSKFPPLKGSKVTLCQKGLGDALNDYNWGKDPELADLDAVPSLNIPFLKYLVDYAWELYHPNSRRYRFAIRTREGKHIGNCSYYNIDNYKGEAELGIMIGDRDYWAKGYGTDVVTTLLDYIFRQTELKRVYLKTLNWNARAQRCFEKCGFLSCGQIQRWGYDFILMDIHHTRWRDSHIRPSP
jgi:RimJ/RimL family protein N-acetyltransferase